MENFLEHGRQHSGNLTSSSLFHSEHVASATQFSSIELYTIFSSYYFYPPYVCSVGRSKEKLYHTCSVKRLQNKAEGCLPNGTVNK